MPLTEHGLQCGVVEYLRRHETSHAPLASARELGQLSSPGATTVDCEPGSEGSCRTTEEEQLGQESHTTIQGKRKRSEAAPSTAAACSSWSRGVIVYIILCLEGERKGQWEEEKPWQQKTTSRQGVDLARHSQRRPRGSEHAPRDEGNGICFAFQDGHCENSSCARQHVCIGCGGNRGYHQCHCLQSKLAALA